MLVQECVLIEAGGEEAAKLRGIAAHGRVRMEGEAENFEVHAPAFIQRLQHILR